MSATLDFNFKPYKLELYSNKVFKIQNLYKFFAFSCQGVPTEIQYVMKMYGNLLINIIHKYTVYLFYWQHELYSGYKTPEMNLF